MSQSHESQVFARLDLNLFRVFEVIYRERNLTRAAAQLHLSQSAVSHALARLREQVGDPLFVRQGRGVAATPRAEQIAPGVRAALEGLQRSLGSERDFTPEHAERVFWINMPEQMEPLLLPVLVQALAPWAPRIELRSANLHWAEVQKELAAGRLDLAVEITRPGGELRQRKLYSDAFCVLAGERFVGALSAERYLAAEHVAVTSQRRAICAEDLALGQLGLSRQVRQQCRNYLSAAMLVQASDWLLTLPKAYAGLLAHGTATRVLDMPLELAPLTLSLYWSRQHEGDGVGSWLRRQVLEKVIQLRRSTM